MSRPPRIISAATAAIASCEGGAAGAMRTCSSPCTAAMPLRSSSWCASVVAPRRKLGLPSCSSGLSGMCTLPKSFISPPPSPPPALSLMSSTAALSSPSGVAAPSRKGCASHACEWEARVLRFSVRISLPSMSSGTTVHCRPSEALAATPRAARMVTRSSAAAAEVSRRSAAAARASASTASTSSLLWPLALANSRKRECWVTSVCPTMASTTLSQRSFSSAVSQETERIVSPFAWLKQRKSKRCWRMFTRSGTSQTEVTVRLSFSCSSRAAEEAEW